MTMTNYKCKLRLKEADGEQHIFFYAGDTPKKDVLLLGFGKVTITSNAIMSVMSAETTIRNNIPDFFGKRIPVYDADGKMHLFDVYVTSAMETQVSGGHEITCRHDTAQFDPITPIEPKDDYLGLERLYLRRLHISGDSEEDAENTDCNPVTE